MQMQEIDLLTIVKDWHKGDPLLRRHLSISEREGHWLYFTSRCNNRTGYAVGFIGITEGPFGINGTELYTWNLSTVKVPMHRKFLMTLNVGDPNYFEKLRAGLITGHNSLSGFTECQI